MAARTEREFADEKIVSASLDAAPRTLLRKHGAAVLNLEHKSKGELSFELLTDDDVERALDYLPDLFDEILEVNIRWDKAKECFIAR